MPGKNARVDRRKVPRQCVLRILSLCGGRKELGLSGRFGAGQGIRAPYRGILHDQRQLGSFDEHGRAILLTVLDELDRFEKRDVVLNRNPRELIRTLDAYSGE